MVDAIQNPTTFTCDTGNRQSVAELSGRTVTYGYDDLYRLTSETVASDPKGNNGQVTYTLDNVGNRLQRNSTLPAIVPTGLLSYDANDRVSTDTFDANGNTTINSGQTNVYDFENHLVQRGGVTVVYDGDGNRVKETVAGVTTSYLVADQNPTGYAQVLDEIQNGAVSRTYSYGLSLISQKLTANGQGPFFYGYDGHGSVRFLTDSTGAITDTYDYDAFGTLISSTGSTPNNYLFAGEQFDPALGIYYNRARYYDQRQGRFWTMDTDEGRDDTPSTLHKYLYAAADPISFADGSGQSFASTLVFGNYVGKKIGEDFALQTGGCYDQQIGNLIKSGPSGTSPCFTPWKVGLTYPLGGRPDLADWQTGAIYEIKSSLTPDLVAYAQLAGYVRELYKADPSKRPWHFGTTTEYVPPLIISINAVVFAMVIPKPKGLIQYYVIDPTDAVGAVALSLLAAGAGQSIPQNVGAVAVQANAAAAAEIKEDAAVDILEDAA